MNLKPPVARTLNEFALLSKVLGSDSSEESVKVKDPSADPSRAPCPKNAEEAIATNALTSRVYSVGIMMVVGMFPVVITVPAHHNGQ